MLDYGGGPHGATGAEGKRFGTFDVLGQGLPCAGVLDAVSAPGGEELDQPGRGGVTDRGLKAAAVQDHQRVLLRVQPGSGSQGPAEEPEEERRLKVANPCHQNQSRTGRAGGRRVGECLPETSTQIWGDMRAASR